MTIQEMITYLETYRQTHNITYTGELNEVDLAVLVEDLNNKILQIPYDASQFEGVELVPYSGTKDFKDVKFVY